MISNSNQPLREMTHDTQFETIVIFQTKSMTETFN